MIAKEVNVFVIKTSKKTITEQTGFSFYLCEG